MWKKKIKKTNENKTNNNNKCGRKKIKKMKAECLTSIDKGIIIFSPFFCISFRLKTIVFILHGAFSKQCESRCTITNA